MIYINRIVKIQPMSRDVAIGALQGAVMDNIRQHYPDDPEIVVLVRAIAEAWPRAELEGRMLTNSGRRLMTIIKTLDSHRG